MRDSSIAKPKQKLNNLGWIIPGQRVTQICLGYYLINWDNSVIVILIRELKNEAMYMHT